jgi:hypothetical protein
MKRAKETMDIAYGVLNKKGDEVSETLRDYRKQMNKVRMTFPDRD